MLQSCRGSLGLLRALRALQQQRSVSHDACARVLQWRGACASSHLRRRPSPAAAASELGLASLAGAGGDAAAVPQPAVPLCERPAQHEVPLADLLAWREASQRAVEAVGDSWAQQEADGPTAEDLQTELGWLLDDTVAAVALQPGGDWKPACWQDLERGLRPHGALAEAGAAAACRLQLRVALDALEALWQQRLTARVPLQYLTASAFWRDVVLSVGPGVLIPRPETELMLDFVAEAVAANASLAAGAWADLGTGSGALAVGVARALPDAERVYAVDLSPTPLAYATFNAARLGVGGRVTPLQGSWYEPLVAAGLAVQLAGIVSNPPYIAAEEMPGLQAEVGRHEPELALCGGEGLGIDSLLPICTGAARMLRPGGFLALETAGGEQAHYIADLLRRLRRSAPAVWGGPGGVSGADSSGADSGGEGDAAAADPDRLAFADVRVRRDLRGIDRFVTASAAP